MIAHPPLILPLLPHVNIRLFLTLINCADVAVEFLQLLYNRRRPITHLNRTTFDALKAVETTLNETPIPAITNFESPDGTLWSINPLPFDLSNPLNNHDRIQAELVQNRLQHNIKWFALIAVPFDKGVGFCVMKKSTYAEKLEKVLD